MLPIHRFVIFLVFTSFFFTAHSQWIPCQGIEGAEIMDILAKDSSLYIATHEGIFRKNINATSWDSPCRIGYYVKLRSTNSAIYAFGPMSDFIRSYDQGMNWEQINDYPLISDLETIDNAIFISDYYSLKRSLDDGESWSSITPVIYGEEEIMSLCANNGILFCHFDQIDSIYKSEDYGDTWIRLPVNGIEGRINDIYSWNGSLWIASYSGVYLYDNNTSVWHTVQDSIPINAACNGFIEDDGTLACLTEAGYFVFDFQDSVWTSQNAGLQSQDCFTGCRIGNRIYLGTSQGPFYKIADGDWIPDYNDLFQQEVHQVFDFESRVYALTEGRIYYSDTIENGFESIETLGYCPLNEMIITDSAWYAGSACGFIISSDSGMTWTAYINGLEDMEVMDIAITDIYFFAMVSYGLFRADKDSLIWHRIPDTIGFANIFAVESLDNIIFTSISNEDSSVFRSEDYGTTFHNIREDCGNNPELFTTKHLAFILTYKPSVLCSADLGYTWEPWITPNDYNYVRSMDITNTLDTTIVGGWSFPWNHTNYIAMFTPDDTLGRNILDNLPPYYSSSINDILIVQDRLFACPSSGGLWYRDDLMVGTSEPSPTSDLLPGTISLSPNPVRDFLTIIPEADCHDFTYQITDLSGRTMFSGHADQQRVQVDVSSLPNGLYFVFIRDKYAVNRTGKFIKI